MEKQDEIYIALLEKAFAKGWSPYGPSDTEVTWTFLQGAFLTKKPMWVEDKIVEQQGACNIEKIIFDHAFAKLMYGEEYTMVLSQLAMLESIERAEYLKLSYLM